MRRRTQSTPHPKSKGLFRALALSVLTLLIATGFTVSPGNPGEQPAQAATTASCDYSGGTAQNELKVTPSHGKVFYIDSQQNQNVDAAYVGYRVENQSGSSKTNLWATLDSFTGGVVQLANPTDRYYPLDALGATNPSADTDTDAAFFLLKAGTSSNVPQSHVLRIYDRDPRITGASELYSCTFSFARVMETIKARANKVTEVAQTTTTANRIGGQLIITVEGQTGLIGSGTSSPDGKILWFSPAARSNWPSGSLRLQSTSIQLRSSVNSGSIGVFVNQLRFPGSDHGGHTKLYYTATYTFRIEGPLPTSVSAIPIAQISSGTQIKHTDIASISGQRVNNTVSLSPTLAVTVTKSVGTTVATVDTKRRFDYTVSLANSGTEVRLDSIVDSPEGGLTYVSGSAKYRGVEIPDPVPTTDGTLVFSHPSGQFSVAGSTTTANTLDKLTYRMETADCAVNSNFDYTNRVYATLGTVTVGESGTRISGVQVTGACPVPETVTAQDYDQILDPAAITLAATAISTNSTTSVASATLNGTVDPNGASGQAITFIWGTSPTLTGATTTTAGASTNSENFYPVSTNLGNLQPGTTYYYRVTIGNTQGEIVSFVTPEVIANPTVATNAVTNITSAGLATFNGTVDPNQVSNGTKVSFLYGLTGGSGAESTCTSASFATEVLVRELDDNDAVTSTDVVLSGSFPVSISWDVAGLSTGKYYCVKAKTTWGTGSAEGSPVLFRIASISPQTISFPTPTVDLFGNIQDLSGATTSNLPLTYTSNTRDVCVVGDFDDDGVVEVKIVGSGICSLSATQDGDIDYYPAEPATVIFSIPSFTVTYNINGGEGQAPIDSSSPYVKGQDVTVTDTIPPRTNYTFLGWNTQANGGGQDYAPNSTLVSITSNTTLYAQWTQGQVYTLTYNANGGTGAPSATSHASGDQVTLAATPPKRPGYRFVEWNTTQTGSAGLGYSSGGQLTISSNVTLWARWVQEFSVSYEANGATSGIKPDTSAHDSGTDVTVAANSGSLERTGFSFGGWNTAANGSGTTFGAGTGQISQIGENMTLYATWYAKITYDANGATSGSAPTDAVEYLDGASATLANKGDLVRSNYRFAGWATTIDGIEGQSFSNGDSLTVRGNTVLYAQWVRQHTLTYDANGGSSTPSAVTADVNSALTLSTTEPNRVGYRFNGWSTTQDGVAGQPYAKGDPLTLTSDTTLWAQWVERFNVIYNSNQATAGSPPSTTAHDRGAVVTVAAASNLQKMHFTFGGWNTAADGTGTTYAPNSGQLPALTGNVTLYARWYANVAYDPNGGTGTTPTDTTEYKPNQSARAAGGAGLSRTGYTLTGWNTAADGSGTEISLDTDFSVDRSRTLYAQWTINSYTIRYDSNGSSDAAPGNQTANHGTSPTVSAAPGTFTKSGFNFDGWNTAADGSGTDYTPGSSQIPSISSDVTLFAKWYAQVTYTSGGATSGSVPTDSTKYQAGQSATVLGNTGSLEKTGFRFGGWQTGAGPTNVNPAQSVTINSNTTFTARWIPVYSVTFDGNGETGGTPPTSRIIDAGDSTTLPGNAGNLVKTNQVFGGWNTQQDGLGTTIAPGGSFTPTADTTLWAIWLPEVTITYDGNGNTGGSSPSSARYGSGQSATVSGNTGGLSRTGFTFSGWQTTPTGGTMYQAGTGTFTITTNITLYARWVEVTSGNNGGGQNTPPTRNPRTTPVITPPFQPPATTPVTPPRLVPGPVTPPAVTTPPATPPGQTTPPTATPPQNTSPVNPPPGGVLGGGSLLQRGVGTVDLGDGPQPLASAGSPAPAQTTPGNGSGPQASTAVRNRQTLLAEQLGGFQPGSTTTVEILGARTGARFVVTETTVIDTVTLVRAMQASIEAQRSDFFDINQVAPATEPLPAPEWNEEQRSTANDLFIRSGLPEPRTLAEFDTSQFTNWVFVSTRASTYAPGTTVYLTLTSQPVVLAEAVVDEEGEVSISGTLPAEILEAGEHRVRLVGIRALDGVSVAEDGSIVVSNELMDEIERFDLGTQSTIAVVGTNPTGETHAAIRIIPLVPEAPWWLLWFIALGFVVIVLATWRGFLQRGKGRVLGFVIVLASATPAVIGGWLSTVTAVTWWGLGLGLLGAAISALQPRRVAEKSENPVPSHSRR